VPAVPLDPEAVDYMALMVDIFPPVGEPGVDAPALRAHMDAQPPLPVTDEVGSVVDRTIPGPYGAIPVRIYTPAGDVSKPAPGVVYFHGGGWVFCGLDTHDGTCRKLANEVRAIVVSVDYRLAPEHKHPASIEDAYAATTWVSEHADELGIDPARLAIAGDSAGGHLTAVVAQVARDRGGPPLAFELMIYPVIDNTSARNDHPSKSENAEGYFLTTHHMNWYREQLLEDEAHGEHALASPHVAESLEGLPPACVITAEMDPLRDEGEVYAELLKDAGVPVTAYRAPGMFHGFFGMHLVLEGARKAQDVAFTAMRDALGVEQTTAA
jgi:acetyl esterase